MYLDDYSGAEPLTFEAAMTLLVFIVLVKLAHWLNDDNRRRRLAKRFAVPVEDIPPWLYCRPWLNQLFEMVLLGGLMGGFLVGTVSVALVFNVLGLEMTSALFRGCQLGGLLVYLAYFVWKNGRRLSAANRNIKALAQEALRAS